MEQKENKRKTSFGPQIRSISDVVANQLCAGCGACAYLEPKRFRMADTLEHGRRPFVLDQPAPETGEALECCPGISLHHDPTEEPAEQLAGLRKAWGPVLAVWEGYAADEEIRYKGSSGGAATALALYYLERKDANGVLHTAAKPNAPYLTEAVVSKSREQLLQHTGSRYASSSPVEALAHIEKAAKQSVFIGKPCDVAAIKRIRKSRPAIDEKTVLTIAFFCAGVPSPKGNLKLLAREGINDPSRLSSLRYRGNGWPGLWTADHTLPDETEASETLTYAESWGYLQKYRQWRCYICPDHTGEFADVSVGDPWYRDIQPGEPGKSLIIARTQRGLDAIQAAVREGYLILERQDQTLLPRSQPNLTRTHGMLWGRLFALRLAGAATPKYRGFFLLSAWITHLSFYERIQSIAGTMKRTIKKKLRKTVKTTEWKNQNN